MILLQKETLVCYNIRNLSINDKGEQIRIVTFAFENISKGQGPHG